MRTFTRRDCMMTGLAGGLSLLGLQNQGISRERATQKSLISITLDLEMARNFPTWETTHWDYEKGNLDEPTKLYARQAAHRVHKSGGVIHFFVVGQVFEQQDLGWLQEIVAEGHPIGNHTYDHINVRAQRKEDLQYRFQRAPWLLRDQPLLEIIRENISLTTKAMQSRLGILPRGFRTPGGFHDGLLNSPEVREILKEFGYTWVSSLYPNHPNTTPKQQPSTEMLQQISECIEQAQPFHYPEGLLEIPMSPISDIGAFRNGRWQLDWFLDSVEQSVQYAIDHRLVFDFLAHPSCLGVVDPEFRTIDLICRLVRENSDHAELCDLDSIAKCQLNPA